LIIVDPDTPPASQILTVLNGPNYTRAGNDVTPDLNFFGTLTVNVRVNDGTSNSNTFPLQVTVTPVNDLPSFAAIANITINEDAAQQSITINNISAGPNETQQMSIVPVSDNTSLIPQPSISPVYNGTATTATLVFRPEPNAFGTATITVTLTDENFGTYVQTFTVTVNSINDAPTLAPITVAPIFEDAPLQIVNLTGISPGGGTFESDQTLQIIPSSNPDTWYEELYAEPDVPTGSTSTLRFKAKPNFHGTVQISVRIRDSGPSSPAPNVNFIIRTFTLVIQPINDLPIFQSEPIDLAEAGVLYTYNIVVTDADNEPITLTAPTLPSWLTYTPGPNGQGTISGTPPIGTTGTADVVISAKDPSGAPQQQGFTISVNSRPVLAPVAVSISEDMPYTFSTQNFTQGFSDADGNPIAEIEITALPDPEIGVLRLGSTPVNVGDKIPAGSISSLTYTPILNATGTDVFSWNAADGFGAYAQTATQMTITITPVNDAPIITVLESDSLKYELGSEIPVPISFTFDGYDPDGDLITGAEITFQVIDAFRYDPDHDELLFQNTPKITGNFEENSGRLTLTGLATAEEYRDAIRTIRYNYVDATEVVSDPRSISITLSDGTLQSAPKARIVKLIYTFTDLDIPTAFTPNGDEANETWLISALNGTEQYSDAVIKVYNKRGVLVHEAVGFEQPWTGVYNGDMLPPDTYFYTIDLNYNRVRYKGTVTILR
jgi:gliding motility-associated-like protein